MSILEAHLAFAAFAGTRLHMGVTGSVAAAKSLDIMRALSAAGCTVGATVTEAAARFVTPLTFSALGADPLHSGMFTPGTSAFGHLEPSQEARAMVLVPATANTLAKLANGIADTMLSCQAQAFMGTGKPMLAAPAMNPRLWEAPATQANLAALHGQGVEIIEPACGPMACGETGQGRLADPRAVALAVMRAISPRDLEGRSVLVTLGPTREHFDPVRYWSNPSSGRMGAAVAVAAWLRGARVHVVQGPVDLWLPNGIEVVDVTSARQMFEAAVDLWPDMDVAVCTAAVADFAPAEPSDHKFKKATQESGITLKMSPTPDILAHLGASKSGHQKLCGFAAETSGLEAALEDKLGRKNCDLMVGNLVNVPGAGFAGPDNQVSVLEASGRFEQWPPLPKTEVAWRIWDMIADTA